MTALGEDPFVYLAKRLAVEYRSYKANRDKREGKTDLPELLPVRDGPGGAETSDQALAAIRDSLDLLTRNHGLRPVLFLDDFHRAFKKGPDDDDRTRLTTMTTWKELATLV